MNSNDIFSDSRIAHIRELKSALTRLKAELQDLREDHDSLSHHFELAALAARDSASIPPGGRFVIVDGWNAVLAARTGARPSRDELIAGARTFTSSHPDTFTWIIFDGPDAAAIASDRMRISYTGGIGLHRADRLIIDFVKMLRLADSSSTVIVVTADRDLSDAVARQGAICKTPSQFPNNI